MSLFNDLDARRERASISRKDLCERAGIWSASYSKWHSGRDGITARNLEKLTMALDALIAERKAA